MYQKYIKRILDIVCAIAALCVFCLLYIFIAVLVRVKLGSPVIFKQQRPGKGEKIFTLYKFRTMTDEKDENGDLLPDEKRMTTFGRMLRGTSFDELPEAVNILKGDMSVVGPRPLLVRDMVFMTPEQRWRHTVRPGLSGLAQVSGRNGVDWNKKLDYDLQYVENITFWGDVRIVYQTVRQVFLHKDNSANDVEIAEDFGDYLLAAGMIDEATYNNKHQEAGSLL